MRYFLSFLICLLCMPAPLYAGDTQDSLQIATRLAKAGAKQLALVRVQREQPSIKDRVRWFEWEILHMALLADLGRHELLLKRVDQLTADAPQSMQQTAYGYAAIAALQLKQPEKSRDYLRHQLWETTLSAQELKHARYMLIESFLEDKPVAAYQAMLRYQQDYLTPDNQQLRRLLKMLLFNGMEKEAAIWLPQLAETDPLKLWIRLKLGALAPEAAMDNARMALQNSGSQDNWLVIKQGASLINSADVRIEAQEALLNAATLSVVEQKHINADNLWKDYADYAQMLGNQNHLLSGDDAAWLAQAAQWSASAPMNARVFWAYLSAHAVESATREQARGALCLSLLDAHLGTTMVRLVDGLTQSHEEREQIFNQLLLSGSEMQQQALLLARAQSAEAQGNFAMAADFALQGAGVREAVPLDADFMQIYSFAVDNLNKAGLGEDAKAVRERLVRLMLIRDITPLP